MPRNLVRMRDRGLLAPFAGQFMTLGTRPEFPAPLFFVGGLAVGLWARVPPPYDVTANRNTAANPLP